MSAAQVGFVGLGKVMCSRTEMSCLINWELTFIRNQRDLDLKTSSIIYQLFELCLLFIILIHASEGSCKDKLAEMCHNTQEMPKKW